MSPVVVGPANPDGVATVADLVDEVYTHLEPSSVGYLNRLTNAVDENDVTFVFDFATAAAIKPNAYLCVDIEVVYVWDYDAATRTATVQRGMTGSIAAAHEVGALVQIQPRVSRFDVVKQLRHDIRSWPPALFVAQTLELTQSSNVRGYNFDADNVYRILDVRSTDVGDSPRPVKGWRYEPDADTTDYPSGKAIIFLDGAPNRAIQVVYAAPFDLSSFAPSTTLDTIGLDPTMYEIPVLGAAARLVREAPRTDTRAQGQSRLAEEVPPMHAMNASKDLMRLRDNRIHQEIARLRESWPQRRA